MAQSYRYPNLEFDVRRTPSDEHVPVNRYVRTNFIGAGVDNYAQPPAQDPEMMMQLTNIMPITDGTCARRWGYSLWANPGITPSTLLYDYQSATTAQRNVILSSTTAVAARNDDGSSFNTSLFTPNALTTGAPREATSRSYAYFSDGLASDYLKWDGSASGGVTNWGIDINSVVGSGTTFGPNGPGTATDIGSGGTSGSASAKPGTTSNDPTVGTIAWGNTNGLKSDNYPSDIASAPAGNIAYVTAISNYIRASNFGFTIPATATILGVQVTINTTVGIATTGTTDNIIRLTPGGTISGNNNAGVDDWRSNYTKTWGNASDTWGLSLTPAVINNSAFGIAISANLENNIKALAWNMQMVVYYSVPGGFTWTNPNNILVQDGNVATSLVTVSGTSPLRATNFGFSVPAVGIEGILVEVKVSSPDDSPTLRAILLRNNVPTGVQKTIVVSNSTLAFVSFGGMLDAWSGTFSASDINNANFGVQLDAITTGGSATINIDYVRITVFQGLGPLSLGSPNSGLITIVSGRTYFVAFNNSKTGHYSDISPPTASTGPLTNQDQPLSGIPVSADPQVDTVVILATSDGGNEENLYLIGSVPNGTTTFTDNRPELTLLAQPLLLSVDATGTEFGLANNQRPPVGFQFPTVYNGRIYMIKGSTLAWSKDLAELTTASGFIAGRWEEAWSPANQTDISATAETPRGMLSDGVNLYIGTEYRIRALSNSVVGLDSPYVIHNHVGILNQDVWQIVYAQGQPSGACWLTPDNKVILSDFNSYRDIGTAIQMTLSGINNSAAVTMARAAFYSKGPLDLYILAIPTGTNTFNDTLCVLNMRTMTWVIWQLTDTIATLFGQFLATGDAQLLLSANTGKIYALAPFTSQDRIGDTPVSFTATAQTSWLDFQDADTRKSLNEIEVQTLDTGLLVTVEGASKEADYQLPHSVISSYTVKLSPRGEYKAYMAGAASHDRYYRFTFVSNNPVSTIVGGFNVETISINRQ